MRRLPSAAKWGGAVLALLVVHWPLLSGLCRDTEEVRFTLFSNELIAQAIRAGEFPFWTNRIGFGIPQPFVMAWILHPLYFLFVLTSFPDAYGIFVGLHLLLGAGGVWKGSQALGLPKYSTIAVLAFLLSPVVYNSIYADYWPTGIIMWGLFPWVVYFVLRGAWGRAGYVAGLMVAAAHPGQSTVYLLTLAVFVLAAGRLGKGCWRGIAAFSAVAAFRAYQIVSEGRLFAAEVPRTGQGPLPLVDEILAAILNPLLAEKLGVSLTAPARLLFLSLPLLIAAFAGLRLKGVWRGVAAAFLFSLVVMQLPLTSGIFALLPGTWVFRDMAVFWGVWLGLAWLAGRREQKWVLGVVIAQFGISPLIAWADYLSSKPEDFAGRRVMTGIPDVAKHFLGRPLGRVYFARPKDLSATHEAQVMLPRLGIPVTTGHLLKGISLDAFYPSERKPYGQIVAQESLRERDLGPFGIKYLVTSEGEVREVPGARPLVSVLASGAELPAELPLRPGCEHDRFLCRDLSALEKAVDDAYSVTHDWKNDLTVKFDPPLKEDRTVVARLMYRPGWIGGEPLWGAWVKFRLAKGTSTVSLRHRSVAFLAAFWLSFLAVWAGVVILVRGLTPSRGPC